jgi:invasion protein IalB
MRTLKLLIPAAVCLATLVSGASAQTKTQKTFGQWSVDCTESDKGAVKCGLRLALINKKTKGVVFGWTIVPGKEEGASNALLQTPTGVLLQEGVRIQFPDAEPLTIAYRICGPRYCFAEFDFTKRWLANFTAQKSLSVMFKNGKGQELKYPVNLERFSEAYEFYTLQLQKNKQ